MYNNKELNCDSICNDGGGEVSRSDMKGWGCYTKTSKGQENMIM